MGTEGKFETMLTQLNAYRQGHTTTKPAPPPPASKVKAAPAPVPLPEPLPEPRPEPEAQSNVQPNVQPEPEVECPVAAQRPPEPDPVSVLNQDPEPTPAPPPPPEPAAFVKAREVIRRPPLPKACLYDAYLPKAPAPIRRPVVTVDEAPSPVVESASQEPPQRPSRATTLSVSPAETLVALEAWSALSPRQKLGRRGR